MWNTRILILSLILVVALVLTVGLVTARTEVVSNTLSNPDRVSAQRSDQPQPLDERYDMSIWDIAACRNPDPCD